MGQGGVHRWERRAAGCLLRIIIGAMRELAQYVLATTGYQLSPAQIDLFERYETELMEWNEQINLTAIRKPGEIRARHFMDSLTCLCVMRDSPLERVIDVGSGAGFPGIPLKIAIPGMRLTLVESVGKKASFLRHIIRTLSLEGVEVIQERAEAVGQMPAHREAYDWAVARAVAIMPVLVEFLLPLARVGGAALAMKGESAPAEVQRSEQAMRILGGRLRKLTPVTVPGVAEERYLVAVDKQAATPAGYPRRTGVPAKKPL
jgi:16S rRNA (guanine527-N7)-methyltransferase